MLGADGVAVSATGWRSDGCFTRERQGGGRYLYTIAERFIPRWPDLGRTESGSAERPQPIAIAAVTRGSSTAVKHKKHVPLSMLKKQERARARGLRSLR